MSTEDRTDGGGVTKADLRKFGPRPCERCGCERVLLRRTIAGNGAVMYFWLCAEGQHHARFKDQWISHKIIDEWIRCGRLKIKSPEEIKVHVEYATTRNCAVCQRPAAEYHHWAPQSMAEFFGDDWHQWPGDYLCKEHHDMWHEIVTPYMPGRRSTRYSKEVARWLKKNGVKHERLQ